MPTDVEKQAGALLGTLAGLTEEEPPPDHGRCTDESQPAGTSARRSLPFASGGSECGALALIVSAFRSAAETGRMLPDDMANSSSGTDARGSHDM